MNKNLFTSEQVSQGHPDRLADQLSDSILDYCLEIDKKSRVACEVMVKDCYVVFGGEITTNAPINNDVLYTLTKEVLKSVGYEYEPLIINLIGKQSQQINKSVDKEDGSFGAGDQGIMFGFATNETESGHILSFHICNIIMEIYDDLRLTDPRGKRLLGPDAKTQVTVDLDTKVINTIVLSASMKCDEETFVDNRIWLMLTLLKRLAEKGCNVTEDTRLLINPAGYWSYEFSGPIGDAGVTGRKIVCDQYGE